MFATRIGAAGKHDEHGLLAKEGCFTQYSGRGEAPATRGKTAMMRGQRALLDRAADSME
jgi:hypothetical protein